MDVINALVELVGPEHKVNLTTPACVILVEVFRVRRRFLALALCGCVLAARH